MRKDENECATGFITRVKDLKDILGDIGEKVFDSDLVKIRLNEMIDKYKMFITGLSAWDKLLHLKR